MIVQPTAPFTPSGRLAARRLVVLYVLLAIFAGAALGFVAASLAFGNALLLALSVICGGASYALLYLGGANWRMASSKLIEPD